MTKAIERMHSFSTSSRSGVLFQGLQPRQLQVYHPERQPDGINYCSPNNGNCSYLCLPAPQVIENSKKTTCACPTGLTLDSDGFRCVENLVPNSSVANESERNENESNEVYYRAILSSGEGERWR